MNTPRHPAVASDWPLSELAEFQKWRRSAGSDDFSLIDYVGCVCTPDLLFGFAELLKPELVIHDGLLFIKSQFSASSYEAWMVELSDAVAVQRMLNHIDIQRLLQGQEVSAEIAVAVARTIAEHWNRVFEKEPLVAEAHGTGLLDSYVTLYQPSGQRPTGISDR